MEKITARDAKNQTFRITRFSEGYRIDATDSFLDDIRDALASWENGTAGNATMTSQQLAKQLAQLPTTKFKESYRLSDVDEFCEKARQTLEQYEAAGRPAAGGYPGAAGGDMVPIYVSPSDYAALERLAGERGESVGQFLHDCVNSWVQ
ncbi:hypothetical protein [Pseudoscardovia suis]|uniref:DivIVA domain-containing protein n=1 Tax=Pseudoscardovia suis TaxID=987063 RepID=A0A261EWC2_9BIFI|nr:hypothetical protein [Pseudoscardovia suis]OZG51153.1 hypothetical protein PSSU_1090 [Pseudoscardovia suis]PJJ65945.1 DivIVA domain-containing protein [Pseudoscardovia suis]